jgi:TRAP-type uncharacterized transport system substrate-binding protein
VVDFYGEDFNLFNKSWFGKQKYKFYSGTEGGGIYFQIGSKLKESFKSNNESIIIDNIPTVGSFENAYRIVSDSEPSLGLAEKNLIDKDDIISEQIDYISPIYQEKMIIVYNKKRYRDFLSGLNNISDQENIEKNGKSSQTKITPHESAKKHENMRDGDAHKFVHDYSNENQYMCNGESKNNQFNIEISPSMKKEDLKFFAKARINLGPAKSGTLIVASYIMDELHKQMKDIKEIHQGQNEFKSNNSKVAIEELEHDKIDIGFFMLGCIPPKISTLLDSDRFSLMSISPTMINPINKDYNSNLLIAKVQSEVSNEKDVMTLGNYTYLVADKKIPSSDIINIMEKIKQITIECKGYDKSNEGELLHEFNFLDYYKNKAIDEFIHNVRRVLLFIVTVATSFGIAFSLMVYSVSFAKQSYFLKKVSNITEDLPNNAEIIDKESNSNKIDLPIIDDDQISIINKIIDGIVKTFELRDELKNSTSLNDSHFSFVQNRIDQIMVKLRKSLYLRLNEIIERQNEVTDKLTKEDIRKYHTADWITEEAYKKLVDSLNSEQGPRTDTGI